MQTVNNQPSRSQGKLHAPYEWGNWLSKEFLNVEILHILVQMRLRLMTEGNIISVFRLFWYIYKYIYTVHSINNDGEDKKEEAGKQQKSHINWAVS